ncbi:unnamed protein product [Paramecium octaurelia]|uniref:Uncharacterized protein n=1 Tax=Paramecium octaurelia TaxID=43137 RepID=A0A8S1W0X2_PAROT|nr:unnamed protein product [Paramecium octaurelia]CAD8182573.1 unnamed protein product [Paramecium octaurelia]
MFGSTPKIKQYSSLLQNSVQHKPIQQPLQTEMTPSTPKKYNILKNVKKLNISSQPTENSFRSNNAKRLMTQDSPQTNKENGNFRIEQPASLIEIQLKHFMQENKKLSDLILKLTKEKQELLDQITNADFNIIKQRIERLEFVIDQQAHEIEGWIQKYKAVCQNDQSASIIETTEKSYIKENKRLNQVNLNHVSKIQSLEQIIKDLDYKVTDQNNQIIAYEEERVNMLQQTKKQTKLDNWEYIQILDENVTELQKTQCDNQQQYDNLKVQFNSINNKMSQMNLKTYYATLLKNNLDELKNNLKNQIIE